MIDLKGKNCLITGATGALGSSLAHQLSNRGCNLLLTGRDSNKLCSLKKELDGFSKVYCIPTDLICSLSTMDLIKYTETVFDIDILINSAGLFMIKDIEKVSDVDIEEYIQLNVISIYKLCRHFSNGMKKRKWGKIVNIGSSSSYVGFKGGSLYCMTKHAVLGLSRALCEELKEYNVQVMCVSPGSMKSKMSKISIDQDFNTFLRPEAVAEQIVNFICMDSDMICKELRLDRTVIR